MLTGKYGKPSEVIEKFDGGQYAQPRDDADKMYKVKFDNCKYNSIWQTEKGNIKLSIGHEGAIKCFVKLVYLDKANGDIIREKSKDDL